MQLAKKYILPSNVFMSYFRRRSKKRAQLVELIVDSLSAGDDRI
jgi:hypothetical protein